MDGLFRQGVTLDGYTQPGATRTPPGLAARQRRHPDRPGRQHDPRRRRTWGLWLCGQEPDGPRPLVRQLRRRGDQDRHVPQRRDQGQLHRRLRRTAQRAGPNGIGITPPQQRGRQPDRRHAPADRNVISGNTGAGICVSRAAPPSSIAGNFVGTDASGHAGPCPTAATASTWRAAPTARRRQHDSAGQPRLRQRRQRHRDLHRGRRQHQRQGQPHRHHGGRRRRCRTS